MTFTTSFEIKLHGFNFLHYRDSEQQFLQKRMSKYQSFKLPDDQDVDV